MQFVGTLNCSVPALFLEVLLWFPQSTKMNAWRILWVSLSSSVNPSASPAATWSICFHQTTLQECGDTFMPVLRSLQIICRVERVDLAALAARSLSWWLSAVLSSLTRFPFSAWGGWDASRPGIREPASCLGSRYRKSLLGTAGSPVPSQCK